MKGPLVDVAEIKKLDSYLKRLFGSPRIRVVVAEAGTAATEAATPMRRRKRVQTHTAPKRAAVVERRSYPSYRSYYPYGYGYPRYRY